MMLTRLLFYLLFLSAISQKSDGELDYKLWCIVDVRAPVDAIQKALDYACANGADCSQIQQPNQPCYLPNTLKDHASFAFNSYYQRFKHHGGTCDFNASAVLASGDPSLGSCIYEFIP